MTAPYVVPMPNTHSQDLEACASGVREAVGDVPRLHIPFVRELVASHKNGEPTPFEFSEYILESQKCVGPAPYVGSPFSYVWRVLVDINESARYIAGPAHARHHDCLDAYISGFKGLECCPFEVDA